jgi:hypothetical protein
MWQRITGMPVAFHNVIGLMLNMTLGPCDLTLPIALQQTLDLSGSSPGGHEAMGTPAAPRIQEGMV